MELDLGALYENHSDSFWGALDSDSEFAELIIKAFADEERRDAPCNCWGERDYSAYWEPIKERAFEALYKWDAEGLVEDPKGCVVAYLAPRSVEV